MHPGRRRRDDRGTRSEVRSPAIFQESAAESDLTARAFLLFPLFSGDPGLRLIGQLRCLALGILRDIQNLDTFPHLLDVAKNSLQHSSESDSMLKWPT